MSSSMFAKLGVTGVPTGMGTIPKPEQPKPPQNIVVNSGYLRFKRKQQTIFLHCEPHETLGAVKLRLAAIQQIDEEDIRFFEYMNADKKKLVLEQLEEKLKEAAKLMKKKPGQPKMSPEEEAKAMEIPPLPDDKKLWELNLENDAIVFFVYRTLPDTDLDEWEEVDVEGLQTPKPKTAAPPASAGGVQSSSSVPAAGAAGGVPPLPVQNGMASMQGK